MRFLLDHRAKSSSRAFRWYIGRKLKHNEEFEFAPLLREGGRHVERMLWSDIPIPTQTDAVDPGCSMDAFHMEKSVGGFVAEKLSSKEGRRVAGSGALPRQVRKAREVHGENLPPRQELLGESYPFVMPLRSCK